MQQISTLGISIDIAEFICCPICISVRTLKEPGLTSTLDFQEVVFGFVFDNTIHKIEIRDLRSFRQNKTSAIDV